MYTDPSGYFQAYDDVSVHRLMLTDTPRLNAFAAAIRCVAPGRVVADVGSGTGILAVLAAKAGAELVYAIEPVDSMGARILALAETNGVGDRVVIITKLAEDLSPEILKKASGKGDGKVDIIVSEWIGFHLFHENVLPSVLKARDLILRKLGNDFQPWQMQPSSCELLVGAVASPRLYQKHHGLHDSYADLGVDISSLGFNSIQSDSPLITRIRPKEEASPAERWWISGPLINLSPDFFDVGTVKGEAKLRVSEKVSHLHGVGVYFKCSFVDSDNLIQAGLSTRPTDDDTHWKQTLVWLPRCEVNGETEVILELEMVPGGPGGRHPRLCVGILGFNSLNLS